MKITNLSFPVLSAALVMLFVASCGNDHEADHAHDHAQADEMSHEVRGRYLSSGPGGEYITIVHETVPDVMNAMRMNFRIDDPAETAHLAPGDIVAFNMVNTETGWYARNITVLPADTELDLPERLRHMGAH